MRQFSQEEIVEKLRSERRHMEELYDEINTLKRENANLKDYVKSLKDECISCPENKKNIKQAQIEILGKLKERIKTAIDTYFNLDGGGYYLAEDALDDIDELIEEVENDKCNC